MGRGVGSEETVKDFDRMNGMDACAVEDLLATGGAGGGHEGGGGGGRWVGLLHGFAHGGKEHHFADGQGCPVVFLFVAKGACHATATAGNDVESAATQQAQHGGGFFNAHEGFLVAVAVEPNLHGVAAELVGGDVSAGYFAHDEFVVEETVAA